MSSSVGTQQKILTPTPPPNLFIANSSTRKTGTPLSPRHAHLTVDKASLAEAQAASVSSGLRWLSHLKVARGRPSLCLPALRIFCASFVTWFIIYFVCHGILISPFFLLMSAFTILAHSHLHVLTCQLHREISI